MRTKKNTIISILIIGIMIVGTFPPLILAMPDTCNLGKIYITHRRGETLAEIRLTGNLTDSEINFNPMTLYYTFQEISGDGFSGKQYNLNGSYSDSVLYEPTQYVDSNSPATSNCFYDEGEADFFANTTFWTLTFVSENIVHNINGENIYIEMSILTGGSTNKHYNETQQYNGTVIYSLQPIISIDSEYYSQINTRVEYTTDNINWYESSYDSITLDNYLYKVKIYDTQSNELIYTDSTFVNYTRHRDIEIDTIKLINNAGEPVWFHISNRTTSYENTTYYNSAELVSMFTGTKNSSDYSCLDYSDFNSLLLEPIGTGQSIYDSHTERYYPSGDLMINGTRSGSFSDIESLDSSLFTLYSNTESILSDYELAYESWFASSYFLLNGVTSNPLSYTYNNGLDWFNVVSEITAQSESSYNSHTEYFNPYSISYTNGSASSGSITSVNTDDTTYLEIEANAESYESDYVSYNYTGTVDSISMANGTYSGDIGNLNSNDDSTVNFTSNATTGDGGTGYITTDYISPTRDKSNTGWTRNTGSADYYTYIDDFYDDATTYLDENAVANGYEFYIEELSDDIPDNAIVTNITSEIRGRRVGSGIFTPISATWYHSNGTSLYFHLGGMSTTWTTASTTTTTALGGINGGNPLTKSALENNCYINILGSTSYNMQITSYRYKIGFEYESTPPTYANLDTTIDFDYSILGNEGNITSYSDIEEVSVIMRFFSNISVTQYITFYNWEYSSWDTGFSGNPTSETEYSIHTLDSENFKHDENDLIFRVRIQGYPNYDSPYNVSVDLLELEVKYKNKNEPIYDTYYGLDFTIEWDIGNLIDIGNMTDKNDIISTLIDVTKVAWDVPETNDFFTISYWNYDTLAWDIIQDTITMSSYPTFDSSLDDTDRLNDTDLWSSDLICKMRWQITDTSKATIGYILEESILSNSTCKIYLDFAEIEFEYANKNDPNYDRTHSLDGYFEWDVSQLVTNGNISSIADIESISMNWNWTEQNQGVSFSWDVWYWDTTSWTPILDNSPITSTFQNDNYAITPSNHVDSSSYKIRFCFNASYDQLDEKYSDGGLNMSLDYFRAILTYQNLHLPVYDWYNYISGYSIIDFTDLFTLGNLTDFTQITDTTLNYNWKTNVSESTSFHAWDFTASEWDLIATDTQTAFATDSSDIYDTIADYFDTISKTARFGYNITYLYENQTTNQDIQLDFDLIQLEIEYWNQLEEYYNWNLSFQIEWDYDEISPFFSWDWVNNTNMIYAYYFDIMVDYVDIEFKYNNTAFTTYHNGVYTVLTQLENLTQPIDYFNNTMKFIMDVNISLYSHWYEPFDMFLEHTNMSITFSNTSLPTYTYEGIRDFLVVPYDYVLHNIDADSYPSGSDTSEDPYIYQAYNVTDLYGNILQSETLIPDFEDYLELNYTSPQMRTCLISYSDQRGNYLDFFQYKTKINGTTIYEQYFYSEVSDWVNISVYDRFDNYITSSGYTVKRDDNWVSVILTLHSLKIFNQQNEFAYFNLTENPTTEYYWSEWLAPNEITEFKLLAGDYIVNVTEYENGTSHQYAYSLAGDDILLIQSGYTIQQAIWNIQNVNTTIGNQITAVNITISNEMSVIENQTILIDFNLGSVNTTIGNMLTFQNTTINAIGNNITTLYTYQQNQFAILDNNINFTFTEINSSIFLVNNSIFTAINSLDTSLELVNNTIVGNLTTILTMNEYLTQLYQETIFSDLINWTDAYRNSTFIEEQIDTWTFINNFKNDSLLIQFMYEDLTESIILSSQTTTNYILPKENVNYRVTSLASGVELQGWDSLDNSSLKLEFGFYEKDISLSDIEVEYNEWIAIILTIATFFVAVFILFAFARKRMEDQKEKSYKKRKDVSELQKTKVRDTSNVYF